MRSLRASPEADNSLITPEEAPDNELKAATDAHRDLRREAQREPPRWHPELWHLDAPAAAIIRGRIHPGIPGKMTVMPSAPDAREECSPPAAKSTTRFGAGAVLAAVALALVAIPGALTLLLVEDKWAPLLRADDSARDHLHNFAVTHAGFVGAMQLISDSRSALAWQIVLAVVVVWLLWRRLTRLALFVVITAAGSSLRNTAVKTAVRRLRPVLRRAYATNLR